MALKRKNDELDSNDQPLPIAVATTITVAISAFAGIIVGVVTGIGPILLGAGLKEALNVGVSTGIAGFIVSQYTGSKFRQNTRPLIFLNIVMITITAALALTGTFYSALVAYIITSILPEK